MIETIPVLLKLPSSHGRFNEVVHMVSASLRENGLAFQFAPIAEGSPVILTERDLMDIYPHLPIIILNAQIAQFANKELGLWIVEGDGAIDTVALLKGCDNDPVQCALYTWRYKISEMLGSRTMTLLGTDGQPNITVFDNFIHAPKRGEVERDMNVFQKFV